MKTKTLTQGIKNLMKMILAGSFLIIPVLASGTEGDTAKIAKKDGQHFDKIKLSEVVITQQDLRSLQVTATEESLEIEDWMLDIDEFVNTAEDPEPAIEKWMTDVNDPFWKEVYKASFPELAIESWMSNPALW